MLFDEELKTQDSRLKTQDSRLKTQDSRLKTQDSSSAETFSDWLRIHKLDIKELEQLAIKFPFQNQKFSNEPIDTRSNYSEIQAWELCAKSLTQFLPDHISVIQQVFNDAPKCLKPKKDKSARPYTLDQGAKDLPFVSCNYTGKVSDLINLAHEFAHAVQIVASRENQIAEDAFMPPLARECCAFWGEIALIDYVQKQDGKLHALLKKAWSNDNLKYLKADAEALKQAIENNDLAYSYDWNYPISRLYALMLRKQMNHKKGEAKKAISIFFASGDKATQLLSLTKLTASLPIPNPLPKMPKPSKTGFTKYQILGAVTALTISDQQIDVERFTVGSFNHQIAKHVENKTLFVYFKNGQPVAYACWEERTKDKISLSDVCTPFVEPEELQVFMRKYYNCEVEMLQLLDKDSQLKEVA